MVTVSNLAQQTAASPREAVVYAPSFFRDDEALLSALRQGQRGARAVFFRRHVDEVELLLCHLLGASGHELVQAVFSEAFCRVNKYDGEADELETWVLRIAVSKARRVLGRRRSRRWLWPLAAPRSVVAVAGTGDASLERAAYELLQCLAPKRAVMLALHWLAELPIEEVAMLCDESLVVVRQQLLAARSEFLELAWGDSELRPWICNVVSQS